MFSWVWNWAWTRIIILCFLYVFKEVKSHELSNANKSLTQEERNEPLVHKLPKVQITSQFNLTKISGNFWKIDKLSSYLIKSSNNSNSQAVENTEVLNIHVSAKFPIFLFMERFSKIKDSVKNPTLINERTAETMFDQATFRFKLFMVVHLSYIKIKNTSFDFRSNKEPFSGISISLQYVAEEDVLLIEKSPDISAHVYDYLNWTRYGEDNICHGSVFYDLATSISPDFEKFEGRFSCYYPDNVIGDLIMLPSKGSNIIFTNDPTFRTRKSCWRRCDVNNGSLCNPQELGMPSKRNQLATIYPVCGPLQANDTDHMIFYSTPITFGYSEGLQIPDIYFNTVDIKPETMIHMRNFEKLQNLNSTLEIECFISRFYAAIPWKLGVRRRDKKEIEFFPDLPSTISKMGRSWSSRYTILIDSVSFERFYCFAPVLGNYDWINASRPIKVVAFSAPMFFVDGISGSSADADADRTSTGAGVLSSQVERRFSFKVGSHDEVLNCNATGNPQPTMTWTRNHVVLKMKIPNGRKEPHEFTLSQLTFPKIDKSDEGTYICTAENSQGVARTIFEISIEYNSGTGTTMTLWISIPIIIVVVVLISSSITAYLVVKSRRRRCPLVKEFITEQNCNDFLKGSPLNQNEADPHHTILTEAFDSKFIIARNHLEFNTDDVLGSGEFGVVLKGWLMRGNHERKEVAIKSVKPRANAPYVKALISEVKIMAYLENHENIVQFLGACIDNILQKELYVAVEICENGNLLNYLQTQIQFEELPVQLALDLTENSAIYVINPIADSGVEISNREITFNQMVQLRKWSRDIARGMTFIRSKNVIHGDLAARNILLSKEKVAKISDFGLSRQLLNDYSTYVQTSVGATLPWKWMALESLVSASYSVQSDVWAYGVTLWEIFSLGDPPYAGLRYDQEFINKLSTGFRPLRPFYACDQIYNIMQSCWEPDPNSRPSIATVFTELDKTIRNLTETER